jgi:gamma-glutamylcyclotransferase (GGCT)/AIG2-like uncharacterized protein YtfP
LCHLARGPVNLRTGAPEAGYRRTWAGALQTEQRKRMDHLIFAYGTLLIASVQEAVIGRRIAGTPDRLAGYRKSILRDGDDSYPNLVPDAAEVVDGRVIDVTRGELARIDEYEGELYTRRRITLESGVEAWVYIG